MIRIAISRAAYEAICATLAALPKGIVGLEPEPQLSAGGKRLIRLDQVWLDVIMRRKGECYSDAILRLARGMGADKNTHIVANAARLLGDAKLLNEHGRHASAFALAVLSLEEIGKVILRLWDVQQRKGYDHLSKQRAVASLLLAQFTVREFGHEVDGGSRDDDEQFVERVAKAMFESEHGRFSAHVEMTVIDKVKQLAIYYDDWWVAAGLDQNFERKDVEDLFEKCRSAIRVVADPKMMRVGRALFEAQAKEAMRPPKRGATGLGRRRNE